MIKLTHKTKNYIDSLEYNIEDQPIFIDDYIILMTHNIRGYLMNKVLCNIDTNLCSRYDEIDLDSFDANNYKLMLSNKRQSGCDYVNGSDIPAKDTLLKRDDFGQRLGEEWKYTDYFKLNRYAGTAILYDVIPFSSRKQAQLIIDTLNLNNNGRHIVLKRKLCISPYEDKDSTEEYYAAELNIDDSTLPTYGTLYGEYFVIHELNMSNDNGDNSIKKTIKYTSYGEYGDKTDEQVDDISLIRHLNEDIKDELNLFLNYDKGVIHEQYYDEETLVDKYLSSDIYEANIVDDITDVKYKHKHQPKIFRVDYSLYPAHWDDVRKVLC